MLFKICMKPLVEVTWEFGLQCHQYSSDAQLYLSIPLDPKEATETLKIPGEGNDTLRLHPCQTEALLVEKQCTLRLMRVARRPKCIYYI